MEQTTPHEIQLLSVIAEHIGAAGVVALALIWGLFRALQEYLKYKKARAEARAAERNLETDKQRQEIQENKVSIEKENKERSELERALDDALVLLTERQKDIQDLRALVCSLSERLSATASYIVEQSEREQSEREQSERNLPKTQFPTSVPSVKSEAE